MHSFSQFTRSTFWAEFTWVGVVIFGGNFIERGQSSRGHLSSGAIILGGNCPRGDNFRGQLSSGTIVRGAIIQGAIIQGTIVRGQFSLGAIVRTPFVLYVKRIAVIITHAAINRGWRLTLNVCLWYFKSFNWIVHIILLIFVEIWSILIDVFAKVAELNAEALNIKSYQPRQKHCWGSAEAKCIFI